MKDARPPLALIPVPAAKGAQWAATWQLEAASWGPVEGEEDPAGQQARAEAARGGTGRGP